MAAITALNRDERTGPNPDKFNYIRADWRSHSARA